jgi:hypothetical protein
VKSSYPKLFRKGLESRPGNGEVEGGPHTAILVRRTFTKHSGVSIAVLLGQSSGAEGRWYTSEPVAAEGPT